MSSDAAEQLSETEQSRLLRKRAYVERLTTRPKREIPDLPVYYYLEHFDGFARELADNYGPCLTEAAQDFLKAYQVLPDYARCLYARLASRKGYIFDPEKLSYAEIKDLPEQLDLLRQAGFVRALRADDAPALCAFLTKPELLRTLALSCPELAVDKQAKKAELAELAVSAVDWAETIPVDFGHLIAQSHNDILGFLLFLYFGRVTPNLQNFTLRDLGVQRAPDLGEDYGPQFDDGPSARVAYFYAKAVAEFKSGADALIADYIAGAPNWPAPLEAQAERDRDRLLQKLGGYLERASDIDGALSLYGLSENSLCNEREIRLRWQRNDAGDRDWVKDRLEHLIDQPGTDEELIFAQDFYARKCGSARVSVMTDLLRAGVTLHLDEAFRNTPERAALAHYKAKGAQAFRMENEPWRALFGLTLWEPLFGQGAQMGSAFDYLPRALKLGTFYEDFAPLVQPALDQLGADKGAAKLAMLKNFTAHYGTVNGIFRWSPQMLERINPLIDRGPKGGAAQIVQIMAQDWRGTKDGFPDLMVVDKNGLQLIEVKAEGDAIRRNQMTRISQLRRAGFNVDIARIVWTVDPDQSYVVVDVETTGGRAADHRITEIGAVKIQGGEVVDEWQSLINPERPIPPFITRLTGISDAMVASAPRFADIADSFAAFMEGSVFVAHNVNFDYGFIAEEYKRLDMWFRFPKLCTVASMRRFYPGQKSYSLKNLCAAYDIDLSSHHRAMCDARAAAELLKMINQARMA